MKNNFFPNAYVWRINENAFYQNEITRYWLRTAFGNPLLTAVTFFQNWMVFETIHRPEYCSSRNIFDHRISVYIACLPFLEQKLIDLKQKHHRSANRLRVISPFTLASDQRENQEVYREITIDKQGSHKGKGRRRQRNEEEEECLELEKTRERQRTRMGQQSHKELEDQERH